MKRSTERFLTTHTGSLPRPSDLVEALNAKELGKNSDERAFDSRVSRAIAEVVLSRFQPAVSHCKVSTELSRSCAEDDARGQARLARPSLSWRSNRVANGSPPIGPSAAPWGRGGIIC